MSDTAQSLSGADALSWRRFLLLSRTRWHNICAVFAKSGIPGYKPFMIAGGAFTSSHASGPRFRASASDKMSGKMRSSELSKRGHRVTFKPSVDDDLLQ